MTRYLDAGLPAPIASALDAHGKALAQLFVSSQAGPSPMSMDQLLTAAAQFAAFVCDGGVKA
jgi:hypothetical protein